jgi:hypothetical protein
MSQETKDNQREKARLSIKTKHRVESLEMVFIAGRLIVTA